MWFRLAGRIGLYFLCGILLLFAFDALVGAFLEPLCEECWLGEVSFGWSLLPFLVLPLVGAGIYLANEEWKGRINAFPLTALGPQPSVLQLGAPADASSLGPPVASRGPWWAELSVWVGISLIVLALGLYLGAHHWVATHTFVAFDAPVTFKDGHLKTGNFYVNLKADYAVDLDVSQTHSNQGGCRTSWSTDARVNTQWKLFRDNQVLDDTLELDHAEVESVFYHPSSFWVPGTAGGYTVHSSFPSDRFGYYNLDIEVASSSACFDMGRPRLRVHTSSDNYTLAKVIAGMFATAGLTLLVLAAARQVKQPTVRHEGLVLIGKESGPHYIPASVRPRRAFSTLPQFGLVLAVPVAPCLILLSMVYGAWCCSIGIPVSTRDPGSVTRNADATPPLVLRLKFNEGSTPFLYLNSSLVSAEELAIRLKAELEHRPIRTVYLQADDDVELQDVVHAIDMVRAWQAKVVLMGRDKQD